MSSRKESLCWRCANFNKCRWSYGHPIKGWTAEKVTIRSADNTHFDTYLVQDCPEFECDRIYACPVNEMAEILNEPARTLSHRLSRNPHSVAIDLLAHGYKLKRYAGDMYWYLEILPQPKTESTLPRLISRIISKSTTNIKNQSDTNLKGAPVNQL